MHTYDNHVQAFMYHVKTEKSAFIDNNLLEQFCHPLCTENDHSAVAKQSWCHFEALECIFPFGSEIFSRLSSAGSQSRK